MNLPVSIGEILEGKYRIDRIIGEGGMGVVVAAQHLTLRQPVAIKFLRAHQEPTLRERFLREARAASRIGSEHVARVQDVGTLADGTPYMVMELLQGQDLDELVKRNGPLPVTTAVTYVLQACEALSEAHSAGIVHRDLKPANLFLAQRPDGREIIKLLDFGISKQLASITDAPSALTNTNSILGSPQFMAPEQLVSSRDVDLRADIWSLGVVLHELLTGRQAFPAATVVEMYSAILRDDPQPVRASRPDVPAELETAILRCLEKDTELRFATIGELAEALAPFAPPEARVSAKRVQRVMGAVAPTQVGPAHDEPPPAPPAGARSASGTLLTPEEPEPETQERPPVGPAATPGPAATTLPSAGNDPAVTPLPQTTGAPVVIHQSGHPPAQQAPSVPPAPSGPAAPTGAKRTRWPWVVGGLVAVGLVALAVVLGLARLGDADDGDDETVAADDDEADEPSRASGDKPNIRESKLLKRADRRWALRTLKRGERLASQGDLAGAREEALRVLDRLALLGVHPGTHSAAGARAQALVATVEVAEYRQKLAAWRAVDMATLSNMEALAPKLGDAGRGCVKAGQAIAAVGRWGPPGLTRCTLSQLAKLHTETGELFLELAEKRARQPSRKPDDPIVSTLASTAKGHLDTATGHAVEGLDPVRQPPWCTAALRAIRLRAAAATTRLARLTRGRPGFGD